MVLQFTRGTSNLHLHAVFALEPSTLTRLLHCADHLTCITFYNQCGRQIRVKLHNQPVILSHMLTLTRDRLNLNLIGSKLNPSNSDCTVRKKLNLPVTCRLHHNLRRSTESLGNLGKENLDATLKEARGIVNALNALHVELISKDVLESFCVATAHAKNHTGASERLAGPDACCAAY
jgi:hypothetical protein